MIVNAKTSMDRFEDIYAGEVFLFGEDYYLKTTMEDFEDLDNLEKNAIVCINLDNGEPRNFKDDDLVLSVSGSFVEIDLNGGE